MTINDLQLQEEINNSFTHTIHCQVGFIDYFVFPSEIYINGLLIYREYRRQGWGSKLLMSVVNQHKDKDIRLRCQPMDNVPYENLVRFYERLGFVMGIGGFMRKEKQE